MRIATKLLMTALLGVASTAMAQDPVTISVTYDNGSLRNAQTGAPGNWNRYWDSNATDPGLTIDVAANNIANGTAGDMTIYVGTFANPNPFTFTPSDGWYVSNVTADVSSSVTGLTVITNQGTINLTSAPQHFGVDLRYGTEPILKIGGTNSPVLFANFTVTLSPVTGDIEPDPALELDAMPAEDPNCAYSVTNVTNGKYNDFTAWYHIQTAPTTDVTFEDSDLYCFIKEGTGYAIYNKALGKTEMTYADGKVYSAGTEMTVTFAQQFLPVSTAYGKLLRDGNNFEDTNKWRKCWKSDYAPEVIFTGTSNCMTTTGSASTFSNTGNIVIETGSNGAHGNYTWSFTSGNNLYVYAYTFLAKKESAYTESSTITAYGAAYTVRSVETRVEATNPDEMAPTAFTQNSINGKGVEMSDFYVTVRRMMSHHNTLEGVSLFPRITNERRIPAIATVGAGEHEGRLIAIYDNRIHGGDIGGGNIGLHVATSDDNGVTWTEPAYGRDAEGNEVTTFNPEHARELVSMATMQADTYTYWDCAFGDAAIVGDRESSRVLMMAVGGPQNFFVGRRHNNPNQCARWYSEDGGQTWTKPENVTDLILELFDGEPQFGCIDSQFIGSGKIMQSRYVKIGDYYRLYAVLSSQNNGNNSNTRNWVLYSDDFGMTWAILGGWDKPAVPSNGDEPKAEELPDGSVLLAARGKTGNRNFNIFRYTDVAKGEGKWFDHVNTDMGFGTINACNGEIMILPVVENATGEHCYLALQSFPYGGGRNYVSIAFKALKSAEDIATPSAFTKWDGLFRVDNGPSVYSTMTWQKNNTIGFLYESNNCDGVYFNFTVDYITNGAYSYAEDTDNAVANSLRDALVSFRSDNYSGAERQGYVGEVLNLTSFASAIEAYTTAPSAETYVAINVAEYIPEVEVPVSGGIYQFISAHHGQYSGVHGAADYDEDVYLSTDGVNLIPTNDEEDTCRLFKIEQTASGNWTLYNDEAEVYIAAAPATYSKYEVDEETPAEFIIRSNTQGHTSLDCVTKNNSGHGGIHLDGNGQIVSWAYTSQASLWHMQRMDTPEDPEPGPGEDSISEIESERSDAAIYDLQGRRVINPTRGLYITNTGKKILK